MLMYGKQLARSPRGHVDSGLGISPAFGSFGLLEPTEIVGIYPQPRACVVIVVYRADIVSGEMVVTEETLEVQAFEIDEIPWEGIGFNTSLWAVRDYVRSVRPDLDVDHLGTEQSDF